MRFVFSLVLIIFGLCGIAVGFLSNISVSSSYNLLDGMEFSMVLAVFSIVVLLNGVYNLFSKS